MRKHGVALEDDAAVRTRLRRQRLAVEQDGAPGRPLLAEQHAQERRLAAAGWADEGDEGARCDGQRDVLEHDLVAIFLPDIVDDEFAHACFSSSDQGKTAMRMRSRMKLVTTASSVIQTT